MSSESAPTHRSAVELAVAIRRGDATASEVLEAHLDRVEAVDDALNAFVTVCEDDARETAAADGHPVGIQLVGPRFDDASVLAASAAFEAERPWPQPYEVSSHAEAE